MSFFFGGSKGKRGDGWRGLWRGVGGATSSRSDNGEKARNPVALGSITPTPSAPSNVIHEEMPPSPSSLSDLLISSEEPVSEATESASFTVSQSGKVAPESTGHGGTSGSGVSHEDENRGRWWTYFSRNKGHRVSRPSQELRITAHDASGPEVSIHFQGTNPPDGGGGSSEGFRVWLEDIWAQATGPIPALSRIAELCIEPVTPLRLCSLPHDLFRCGALVSLTLQGHALTSSAVGSLEGLTALKRLVLSNDEMVALPSGLGDLPALTHIDLSCNKLRDASFPPDGTGLQRLTHVYASRSGLASLSSGMARLRELREFVVAHNKLSFLPSEVVILQSLECLDVGHNRLSALPSEVGFLTSLHILRADNNRITTLPNSMGLLTSLTELTLGHNKITKIPPEIGQLLLLESLDLSNNSLLVFPSAITDLVALKRLNLQNNRIQMFPSALSKMVSLVQLNIAQKGVDITLPVEFNGLTRLTELEACNFAVHGERKEVVLHNGVLKPLLELAMQTQHPLLALAISNLSHVNDTVRVKIVQEGGLRVLISYAMSAHRTVKSYAIATLESLSLVASNQERMLDDGSWMMVASLSQQCVENKDVDTIRSVLRTMCNLAWNINNHAKIIEQGGIDNLVALCSDVVEESLRWSIRGMGNLALGGLEYRERVLTKCGGLEVVRQWAHHPNAKVAEQGRRLLHILGEHERTTISGTGIRILAMDGGGTKGVTIIAILKELERAAGRPVHEMFDMICGASTGGILAFMLGIQKLPLGECDDLYRSLSNDIFPGSGEMSGWHRLRSLITSVALQRDIARYSAKPIESVLQNQFGEDVLIDIGTRPGARKVFAMTTQTDIYPPETYVCRNYEHPTQHPSRYRGTSRISCWAALRATSAAPTYFEEFEWEGHKYQDGGVMTNNPSAVALHEAARVWPGLPVECFVSIGTGNSPATADTSAQSPFTRTVYSLIYSACSSKQVHDVLEDTLSTDVYYRLSPTDHAFDSLLDVTCTEKLDAMQTAARRYIETNAERMEQLVSRLVL